MAASLSLVLSGCASAFGSYDLAPNGLPREEATLRQELAQDPAAAYEAVVEGELRLPDDDLLRLLYAASTGREAGRYHETGHLLDVASYVAEDRITESVSRQALSFFTNDRVLPYTPSPTERLMIPYVAAVSFLRQGDLGGAVVEARRIEALLEQADGLTSAPGSAAGPPPADRVFFHHFAAAIFEAAGERNAARVAYRRAGVTPSPEVPDAYSAAPADSLGEVVVLVERGFVPHRVEQSVVVVLPPIQVRALTRGDPAARAVAATAAAGQVLLSAAGLYGQDWGYYTDRRYRSSVTLSPWRDQCGPRGRRAACAVDDDAIDPYLLRISWPVLFQDPGTAGVARLEVNGRPAGKGMTLDVSAGIRRDFAAEQGTILARTVFRAATKMALSAGAESAVARSDEAAGRLVGLLVNLGTLLTERADTRSWHLLPGWVEMIRVRLPAGTHRLTLDTDGWLGRGTPLGPVDVRAGRTTFLSHRVWP